MNRDWQDFKSLHSNIAGAREAFENACETLFRKINSENYVGQVAVKQGDGGIDIFIGNLGVEPITVIQCKFFLDSFKNAQKSQIRKSFKTASESKKYELKEWILCVPRVIDIDDNSWWFGWRNEKIQDLGKSENFISLKNGNDLIDLMKEHGLYNQIFQIEDSIKIHSIDSKVTEMHKVICGLSPATVQVSRHNSSKTVLFNNYDKKSEDYYLNRECDNHFISYLELSNIWMFGKSGMGKTALVNRNLIKQGITYYYCDLSPISIESSNDVLEEILSTLEDNLDVLRQVDQINLIKQISVLLCKVPTLKIVIVIDELSIPSKSIVTNVVNDLTRLVNHHTNKSNNDSLRFVISTIDEPSNFFINKSKASGFFEYICCDDWTDSIDSLYDVISHALNIDLPNSKRIILDSCRNSPRILKNIFRKIVLSEDRSERAIVELIEKTLKEVV